MKNHLAFFWKKKKNHFGERLEISVMDKIAIVNKISPIIPDILQAIPNISNFE